MKKVVSSSDSARSRWFPEHFSFQRPSLRLALILTSACFALAAGPILRAQGALTPPGPPAPTQHSLEELYSLLIGQQAQLSQLQGQLTRFQLENRLLFYYNDALAWINTLIVGGGNTGAQASVAFPRTPSAPLGRPAIAYFDVGSGSLNYAYNFADDTQWSAYTVDASGGRYLSHALAPDGRSAIAYYDQNTGDLKFALAVSENDPGQGFNVSTVDAVGNVGAHASLAYGPDGQPAIAYFDATGLNLKFAQYNGSTWTLSTVATAGDVGRHTSLAFSPDGAPHIAFSDNGNLRVLRFLSGLWTLGAYPFSVSDVRETSLRFDAQGQQHLVYISGSVSSGLNHFVYGPSGNTSTLLQANAGIVVTTTGQSLTFGPDGRPVIAYYHSYIGQLNLARLTPTGWSQRVLAAASPGSPAELGRAAIGFDPTELKFILAHYEGNAGTLRLLRPGLAP